MNVYIQKNNDTGMPHHFDAACAYYGACDLNYKVKLVSYEDVVSGKYDLLIRNHLFVGSVEFMTAVFERVGCFPEKLPNNDREVFSTLGEVRERISNGEKLFVKPRKIKLFTGTVYDKYFISSLDEYPDDLGVIVDEPFKSPILAEWRVYVRDGVMEDSRSYLGEHTQHFNIDYVQSVVAKFKDIARCFTCDIAILEDGTNICVELNDMWAIGNYGMDNELYVKMLKARYFEIVK